MSAEREDRLKELREVLDAYGADRSRWPSERRSALERFAGDPSVASHVVEAGEIDRALAAASPDPQAHHLALKHRILARVRAEGQARVVPSDAPSDRREGRVVPLTPKFKAIFAVGSRRMIEAGALVAACLLIGIFLGSGVAFDGEADEVASTYGLFEEVTGAEIEEDYL
ncbi:MAG: hypothetical protein NW217_06885 [Hyphomicrobiaceae bacterium]|nr:hypothetical protein [Hyphomicrobiaceae bacterium]